MINGTNRNEHEGVDEPSERFVSLVLEINSALREGRMPALSECALGTLSADERRQLVDAWQQLDDLYAIFPRQPQSRIAADTRGDRESDSAVDDTADFSVSPNLRTFLGIHGAHFGRFEVLRGLGMGGHGVVFLARDPVLDRLVALKVPRPDVLVNPSFRKRFLTEGRAAAGLTHPNIVTVFESGEIGPVCYLAQDYIPGPTLAQWLRDHPEPVDARTAAGVLLQLSDAVSLAHSSRILHRDIKPGNVLLAPRTSATTPEDLSHFVPKLADFGLAKSLTGQEQTQTAGILGTPAYMSPEQAAGRNDLIGTASDVYSLGAVLYQLLTHQPVYHGKSDLDTLQQVLHDNPRRLRSIAPEIPQDLEAICQKCLQREPQDRYHNAQDLADDLRRFLDDRPVTARPLSWTLFLARWSRRNPAVALLTATVFCGLVLLLSGSVWFNRRLNHSLQAVREQQKQTAIRELALLRRVYADDLNLAGQAWANGDVGQVRKRLEAYIPRGGEPDFRSFPWWILWRLSQESSQVFGRHEGGASAVAVDESGTLAASAGVDGIIRLWQLPEGKLRGELRGHEARDINSLHFSPGATDCRLVSAGDDGTARIWSVDTRSPGPIIRGHNGWVGSARFLGFRGETLATAGEDQFIRIWDAESGELLREIFGHTDIIRNLDEDPARHLLVSTSEDGTVRVWDWQTGLPDARLPDGKLETPGNSWARVVAFNQDKSLLAAGFRSGEVLLWNMTDEQFGQSRSATKLNTSIRSLAWRGETSLLVGEENTVFFARDTEREGFFWEPLKGHAEKVMAVATSSVSGGVVSAGRSGAVRWWPANNLDGDARFDSQCDRPFGPPAWSGTMVMAATIDRVYAGFGIPDLKPSVHIHLPPAPPTWFCLSPDGRSLMTSQFLNGENCFAAISTADGGLLWHLPLQYGLNFCQISPDGRTVALCFKPEVWLVDAASGRKRTTLPYPDTVHQLEFSPDSSTIVTVCADGHARMWNVATASLLQVHRIHQDSAGSLCLSRDGLLLATRGEDRKARVWRLADWTNIASFSLDREAGDIALLDEGRTLATVCGSKLIFWSVPDQVKLMEWDDVWGEDKRLSFSPDRKSIVLQDGRRLRLLRGTP